jgi:hypothetical protein
MPARHTADIMNYARGRGYVNELYFQIFVDSVNFTRLKKHYLLQCFTSANQKLEVKSDEQKLPALTNVEIQ